MNDQNQQEDATPATQLSTDQEAVQSATEEPRGYFNLRTKTLGGRQFWTDVRSAHDWRIQRNTETGHFRLLDPSNTRFAWGNQAHCDTKLNQLVEAGRVKLHRGKVVIALHGMIRTRSSMATLCHHLRKSGEYEVINFQYASTRAKVAQHSARLKELIDSLGDEVTEINLVGHSLGNIVVRHYMGQNAKRDARGNPIQGDPRIKRMVMIGPPNQGSKMARTLQNSALYKTVAGASGMQLSDANQWQQLQAELATPNIEFGIIAGGQKDGARMSNFVLDGKDDFTVSVEEAKLPGASDFLVHPLLHGTMMRQTITLDATLNFFRHGYLVSKAAQNPLPKKPAQAIPKR